jgi:hypothetical protein
LLAMGMEFFRFRTTYSSQEFYQTFTSTLLLTGVLSAAITVIMGLLLSKETGYTGSTVEWHKWMGVSIVFIGSFIYWSRNANWYKAPVAKISAVVIALCLIIAGHLGAGITHGDDFISTPMMSMLSVKKVSADKAVIYTDVVQPIFTAKCMSCHNSGKAKGGLVLDNPEDILKGGKNGKLFVAGHSDSSLVIERINLPEEEKKHMPLTGKPQLTKDEMELVYRWIQSGADFKKKVMELPEKDSLRLIAIKFLAPPPEEEYTFSAADEKTIQKLSNNYRVIFSVAKESPALVVDFYNKKQFSSKALEELTAVKKQIVELNLDKMPVTDADLKTIGQFENLRTLNLNFSDISGEGLKHLSGLKYLQSVSLSGTKINNKNIQSISSIKSMKEIFVWNTGLKEDEIAQLQKANKNIRFVAGYKNEGPIQLNNPVLQTANSVFTDTIHLFLTHPIPGAEIHYSLDGSNPDSTHSPIFNKDLVIDKTVVFKARAFKNTWLGSDSIMSNFYKSAYRPDSINFISFPADSYKGEGPGTLTDHMTGDQGFGSGKWLGFQKDMEISMQFIKPVKLSSVDIHMLKNVGGDIYPPTQVQVWGGKDKAHLKLLQTIKPVAPVKGDIPSLFLVSCNFTTTPVSYLKVVAMNVKSIPKWGTSPKKAAWVFADEILLN